MRHLAVLSMHTSPLVQPGSGDGGGMTVYVREIVCSLARAGGQATVFTRRDDAPPKIRFRGSSPPPHFFSASGNSPT